MIDSEGWIKKSLTGLIGYIEKENYVGYDPYDALNTRYFNLYRLDESRWMRVFLIQLFKKSPINFRPFLKTEKGLNPKGIALILSSYIKLYQYYKKERFLHTANKLVAWLKNNYTKGFSGPCWGYNFNWSSKRKDIEKYYPSVVVTSFVDRALLDYFEITNDYRILEFVRKSCDFILNDLHITENENGVCFSYTPLEKDLCHNANSLGAEILARVYSITGEGTLLEYTKKAFNFVFHHQNVNGSWYYLIDPKTGIEDKQIDFHQGFILDSLHDFIKYTRLNDSKYINALIKGAEFYKNEQFFPDGRCKWRYPRVCPVDIHNQAQGIMTFSKLSEIKPEYLNFAKTIAKWTIDNMQDENGYFYYQKWPFFTNKIPYMRWGQAWMMLALAILLEAVENARK